jgi:hypothetical protein
MNLYFSTDNEDFIAYHSILNVDHPGIGVHLGFTPIFCSSLQFSVLCFALFAFILCVVCPILPVPLDYSFFVAFSGISNIYLEHTPHDLH